MSRRLPFFGGAVALAVVALASSGCVDRRFVVESDPPGSIVYMNGRRIGATPLEQPFTYYGKYRFEFVRDGYETLVIDEQVCTPWWSYFPLEFFVENLLPYTIRDLRYIPQRPDPERTPVPPLQPIQVVPAETILQRAGQLRNEAQGLGSPPGAAGVNYPPGTVPVPISGGQ